MRFFEVLHRVIGLLVCERRVTYQALKLEFGLDEAFLEGIRAELIFAKRVARDEHGTVLVWTGGASLTEPSAAVASLSATLDTDEHLAAALSPLPPLATASPHAGATVVPEPTHSAPEAERRQITVVFCDLVDSTRLSQQLDAEDYRAVVRAYQEAAVAAMQPFGGYVAQYLGDGLMLYFGWPQTHEDATPRAVYASLAIVEALEPLNTRLEPQYGVRVAVRIGLHTGLAVVGAMGSGARQEQLAMGDTPNIAARLQSLAAPDTVAISAATARLVQRAFALEELGTYSLKGVAAPLPVFRVRSPLEGRRDDEATVAVDVPYLVGRDEEIGLLRRRWAQSQEGLGQVVLITGEAGIGKSSLVQVIRAQVAQEGLPRITLRCSPYHTHSALYPLITHLHHLLQVEREEAPDVKLAKLERVLQPATLPLAEVVPLLAALLAIAIPEGRYPALDLSPQQQRQYTLEALQAWLLAEADRQPLLVLWEDLHWADPTTLELLGLFVEQAPTAAMLHVLTFRPEFVPPWPPRSHLTPLTLNRLERPQVEALVTRLAKGKTLPPEVMAYIVAKTDGVPLYVEELTKTLLESALLQEDTARYTLTGPLTSVAIPATLQETLMARLDRLPTVREVAQLGAVLGREFAYEMLQALAAIEEPTLQDGLTQLVRTELLYQRGRPPRARYIFKHALVHEAAYQSLLRRTRQHYHQQVAHLMEARYADLVETEPELVAHHYTEAGCPAQAIPYWQRAGQQALQRSANLEAVQHLTTALELLATLPETPARAQQELDLQLALGPALMVTRGYAAPEMEQTYARARALCQQVGDTPQRFPTLQGLWRFYHARGALPTARELGEQLVRLAERAADPTRRLEAHAALGHTLYFLGDYAVARTHCEQGIALSDPTTQRAQALRQGEALGVRCLATAACTLWCLGYPAQAVRRSQEALTLAQALAHPFSLGVAQMWAAYLHYHLREAAVVQAQAEPLLALATAQRFPLLVGFGTCWRGWALAMQGESEAGLAQLRQGLAAVVTLAQEVARPRYLLLLAEASGHAGQAEEGLCLLAEAVAVLEANGQGDLLAEAYRLQGVLLLRQAVPDAAQAEACFQQALTIARQQQARSWELRAAVSLARLWQQQGKRQDAHGLLASVYGWFTEGFDTADLQEAKAVLEALA
jgi:predicted ATPase/class 3 adenylate cyclase